MEITAMLTKTQPLMHSPAWPQSSMVPKKLELLNAQPRAAQGCLGQKEAQPDMHTPAHHRSAWVD